VILDGGAVTVGAWLAYAIRFSALASLGVPMAAALPPLGWYIRLSLVLAALTIVFLMTGGMYRFPLQQGLFEEISSALRRYVSAITLLLAGLFFYRGVSFSRMTLALMLIICGAGLVLSRSSGRWFRQVLYRGGVAVRRAALVGEGFQAGRLLKRLTAHPEYGVAMIGGISDTPAAIEGLRSLGGMAQVRQAVTEQRLDTLIIAPAVDQPDPVPELVRACYGLNVDFLYVPDVAPTNGRPRRVVELGGIALLALKEAPFTGWPGVVKRGFDMLVGSLVFLMALPALMAASIAVMLESRGPLIYRQRRVGLDGVEFDCYKIRSMRVDAEAKTGAVWATRNDPRVTRVGRLLRRWSLDELPQLWNVICGDMSLVGPRPERPEFVRQFERRIDGYHERHRVRAGLTGWAQVNGFRGDTPIEDRTVYDRYYVENWSLGLDLRILFRTAAAIVKGENSY